MAEIVQAARTRALIEGVQRVHIAVFPAVIQVLLVKQRAPVPRGGAAEAARLGRFDLHAETVFADDFGEFLQHLRLEVVVEDQVRLHHGAVEAQFAPPLEARGGEEGVEQQLVSFFVQQRRRLAGEAVLVRAVGGVDLLAVPVKADERQILVSRFVEASGAFRFVPR